VKIRQAGQIAAAPRISVYRFAREFRRYTASGSSDCADEMEVNPSLEVSKGEHG
jgi:hypothetical protein